MSTNTTVHFENGNATPATIPIGPWFVFILGALSAGLLGAVVGSSPIDTSPEAVAILAATGYFVGFILARTTFPDVLAHFVMISVGVLVSLAAIDPVTLAHQARAGEWRLLVDRYETLLRQFFSSAVSGDKFQSEIAVFAIGLTIWLVGSLSAWMLFRRNWVFWSVATPGAILLMTLALDRERDAWTALVYLGLAFAIAASQTAIGQTRSWNRRGIELPRAFGMRSIVPGLLIAGIAIGLALSHNFDLDDRVLQQATNGGDRLASWVEDRLGSFDSGTSEQLLATGNYGSFADQFKVGDGIPSGDVPIVVMDANQSEYLAARRLNDYDGTGWKSTTSQTQVSTAPAPRIAFQSDQPMNIPRDQLENRMQDRATITLLHPGDGLLFTIDQHFSASEPTLVRVGWEPIDESYTIGQIALSEVPVDLRELVVLLQTETFAPHGTSSTPELEDPRASAELSRISDQLLATYPVTTELSWTDDGNVLLHAKGRLPVYSDIEAVFSSVDLGDGTYSVVGLTPDLSAIYLERAGTGYPQFITDTYLELPDTVTQETRDLASQIVLDAGAATPFDQAMAIQTYLRANFTYQLDAGPAPNGRDIVDYFLFDSRVGRCDHYASSMAVMLRSLGVPARIVTGLAPVSFDSDMGGYVYRGRNAHAWVEVYFPDFGWIPFEPTPSEAPIDLEAATGEDLSTPEPTPTVAVEETPVPDETISTPVATPTTTPMAAPATTDIAGSAGDSGRPSNLLLILGGIGFAVLSFGSLLFLHRRRTFAGMPAARANFSRLQRLGRFIGVESLPELTPREYAERFGMAKPKSAAGAIVVADAFTHEQYATNIDAGTIAHESEFGWKEAKQGASDWRIWRRR